MIQKILKLGILTALFIFTTDKMTAQGNLQFNQVKLVSTSDTVPVNKVWKVESILYSTSHENNASILLNGQTVMVRTFNFSPWGSSSSTGSWEMKFPFWIPSTSTLASGSNVRTISIIEYNIIP